MKDILNKPAKTLDLSQEDNISYSPYTLDLSPEHKTQSRPDRRQTNFFEYMPTVIAQPAAGQYEDDEIGVWRRFTATVQTVVAPLRMYWAVMIGIGLIVGLSVIAYIATHRDWTAAYPRSPFGSTAPRTQGNQNSATQAPGKGGGSALQSATPDSAQKIMPVVGASGTPVSVSGGGGAAASSGAATHTLNNTVQQAPLPVATPAPTPAPTAAPLPMLQPVNDTLAPVTDKIL